MFIMDLGDGQIRKQILPAHKTKPFCTAPGSYLLNNFFFAVASSLSLSSPTLGYARSRSSSVSITAAATTTRVNHLLFAGTTYHGAAFVAVSLVICSYASLQVSQ